LAEESGFLVSEVTPNLAGGLTGASVLQGRSIPAHGESVDFPSDGFQIFHFQEALFAQRKVLLAHKRICRIQLFIEKRMKSELPFRTGTGCIRAALERRRAKHGHAHEITEREAPRTNGDFVESLPFYQLHRSSRSAGAKALKKLAYAAPHERLTFP
jgi:hypothetical protein